uniref:Ig-like domain-containing protein n=1 Tax=Labrus bergylta TaxID=56723 RepID=A0A3Q3LEU0_9LABR
VLKNVQKDIAVEIKCSHNDTSLVNMLWYQQRKGGTSLTLIGYGYESSPTYEGQFEEQFKLTRDGPEKGALIISKAQPSHSAVYFCAASNTHCVNNEAYFGPGTKLTVLEHDVTPPTVIVLPASPKECGHQGKTIVCVASGFYPDHVSFSWTDKEGEVSSGVATDSEAVLEEGEVSSGVATDSEAVLEEGKTYMMSSRLRVSAEEWNNPDNEFTCTVHFFDGDKTVPYSASVKGIEGNNLILHLLEKQTQRQVSSSDSRLFSPNS